MVAHAGFGGTVVGCFLVAVGVEFRVGLLAALLAVVAGVAVAAGSLYAAFRWGEFARYHRAYDPDTGLVADRAPFAARINRHAPGEPAPKRRLALPFVAGIWLPLTVLATVLVAGLDPLMLVLGTALGAFFSAVGLVAGYVGRSATA